jgi:Flp pilus assembly protein TadB
MSDDRHPARGPERPKREPEIIPPDRAGRQPEGARVTWTEFDDGYRVHRIYVARPGLPAIILGLLILGAIAALVFLVVAGVVLLWLPILIGGIVLALLAGALRYRWRRLRAWWQSRQ